MFCPCCHENKVSLTVLSRLDGRRICVDCFSKEKGPIVYRRDMATIQKDMRQAMDELDAVMRDIDELYPDLKPKKYVMRFKPRIQGAP